MNVQTIIDTFNYSAVTGCRLTPKASEQLYRAIVNHLNLEGYIADNPMVPRYTLRHLDLPENFMTFTGYKPKTKMLVGNYCELELLRILYLLKPETKAYQRMYLGTKERLAKTCVGTFWDKGECLEISIMALRFIATVFPDEKAWIDQYVSKIAQTILEKRRKVSRRTLLMFSQVLAELRRDQDGDLIDGVLDLIDDRQLANVSAASTEINASIFYSSLRRVAFAS